jgi:ArsR family transcriptional regulator
LFIFSDMNTFDLFTPSADTAAPAGAETGTAEPAACAPAAGLQAAASQAAGLLRTLANPERLMLMCALAEGEQCVTDLARATGIQQPTLSQQLGVLREEGLVATRREGKFIFYRVCSPAALELMSVLYRLYCSPSAPPS